MTAEHPEIQPTPALVLLTNDPDFLKFANFTRRDQLPYHDEHRVITVTMRDGQPHAFLGAKFHDLVSFHQGTHEWLFYIDAFHACLNRGDNHVAVFVNMPGADRRDVGLGLGQHFPVVGIAWNIAQQLTLLG